MNVASTCLSTSSTLTAEGIQWLHDAPSVNASAGAIYPLADEIAAGYNVTLPEVLIGMAGALSLAIGSSAYAQNPFGCKVPLTLQLVVVAGINPNFDRCYRYLCQEVVDAYAAEFGRNMQEDTKTLTADQIAAEQRFRARGAEVLAAEKEARELGFAPGQPRLQKIEMLKAAEFAELLSYYRVLRKKLIFPYGSILDGALVQRIVEEDRDVCYGCFSADGSALRHILDAPATEKGRIVNFLNAGFQGEIFSSHQAGPVFPVASALWICSPALIAEAFAKDLHTSLTGLMVLSGSPAQEERSALLTPETRERWSKFIGTVIKNARTAFYRRHSGCQGHTCVLEAEATEALSRSLEWSSRFTTGAGYPRTVLGRAPEQILKIASLMNLDTISPKPVDAATVVLASELFRLMARDTIGADSQQLEAVQARDVDALQKKLRVQGPLSRRDLVRSYHRGDYGRLDSILAAAMESGQVTLEGDLYRAVAA